MSFEWKKYPLSDLLELIIDHRGKTPKKLGFNDFHSSGYPVLSAKHVKTTGLVNVDGIRFANKDMYRKWMKVEVQEGDIVLTSEAPMGELFYIDGRTKYVLGQRVFGLRPKRDIVNPNYLFAWFASRKGQDALTARATGTTVLGIKQSELLRIEIDVPPIEHQDIVANNLFALSSKIHLNTQINQTLEQIAQAIFKSWFVDFDPVKAKMAVLESGGTQEKAERAAMGAISGKNEAALEAFKKENPEGYAELAETAALFPAAMVESELGEIPEGWEVGNLEQTLNLLYGKALKKTARIDGNYPVYGSGGINGYHNQALVAGPGIIVGRKGTVGTVYWEDADFFPIDTVFYVEPKDNIPLSFLFYLLKTLGLENMNTDAAVPGLNRNNAYRLEIVFPYIILLEHFDKVVSLLRKRIKSNCDENKSLEQIRDTLLPKLLSGEVTL